jgi:hypothetical protein
MARKSVSLKPVVKDIDKATKALEKILWKASPKDQKKLNLKIKALRGLKARAKLICHGLNIWVPLP